MPPFDSCRDAIDEHARNHRFVISAWIVVALAAAILLVIFA